MQTKEEKALYQKGYRERNKEKLQAYIKEYNINNNYATHKKWAATNKETIKNLNLLHRENNQEYHILLRAVRTASVRSLEINIEVSDIVIPTHCPYLGIELTNIVGQGRVPSNASIDRIDSNLGYVKGNIQIISELANRMKTNATTEELISFAKGVLKLHA